MSVVGIAQEAPDSPGDASFELGKYSITRTFLVQTNNIADGPIVVVDAIGIPRLFTTYSFGNEFQPYMRARHYGNIERLAPGSLWWKVPVTYTTPEPKEFGKGTRQETEGEFENPLLELAKVSWSSQTVQIPITSIFNVTTQQIQPIKNSAGQIFVPPPNKDQSRSVLSIRACARSG